jgi:transmembrane sensor
MSEFNEDLIIKYLENDCSEEEEQRLLQWLQHSEENVIAFLNLKKIYNLRNIQYYSDEKVLNNALLKFEALVDFSAKDHRKKLSFTYLKYAAVFLLASCISLLFWLYQQEKPVELTTIKVGVHDQVKIIILPDGSKVWVNNESTFTYPVAFSEKERIVTIEGEAFFEVKHDPQHPFLVQTGSISVRVLGTSFNVKTKTVDRFIETTLEKGKVSIEDNQGKGLIQLSPGQLGKYNLKTEAISVNNVNTDQYTAWRNGVIIFHKANLNEITKKIENFYRVRITINSNTPIKNKYNFVFRRTQSLDTVLEMLKFVAPITYKKHDEQVYINVK